MNRQALRKLIEAGKVSLVSAYSFDDVEGASREVNRQPVAICPANRSECKPGVCYVRPSELTAEGGYCRVDAGGIVHLRVHSNSNYDFRIAP